MMTSESLIFEEGAFDNDCRPATDVSFKIELRETKRQAAEEASISMVVEPAVFTAVVVMFASTGMHSWSYLACLWALCEGFELLTDSAALVIENQQGVFPQKDDFMLSGGSLMLMASTALSALSL